MRADIDPQSDISELYHPVDDLCQHSLTNTGWCLADAYVLSGDDVFFCHNSCKDTK